MKLWNQILLEELQIDIYFRLSCALARSRRFLLSGVGSFLSKISDGLFKDLLKNLFEHPPRIRDFVHDLAEDFQAQEHVQNDLSVVGQYLILLDHLFI